MELLGHIVILYLIFWGTAKLFPVQQWLYHFISSLAMYEGSSVSISSPTLVTVFQNTHTHNLHLSRYEVVSHCGFGFDLRFPNE